MVQMERMVIKHCNKLYAVNYYVFVILHFIICFCFLSHHEVDALSRSVVVCLQ